MMRLGYVGGMMPLFFEFQTRMVDWLVREGTPEAQALLCVRAMQDGLAAVSLAPSSVECRLLPVRREARGGLNEASRRYLLEAGWFDEVSRAMDVVRDRTKLR
jgi:pyrroline-5-carboxylate reductase